MATRTTTAADEKASITERDERALTQYLTVLDDYDRADGEDLFMVVSQSGEQYLVDLELQACECADHQYRETRCKHIRRAEFATGERPIPASAAERLDVDEQLGEHVDGELRFVAPDGGVIDPSDRTDDVDVQEPSSDDRPDDCECGRSQSVSDLPCFACYRAGYESINRQVL